MSRLLAFWGGPPPPKSLICHNGRLLMSKLHDGKFPVTCGITKALAIIRNAGSNLELNTKEQALLHLAEKPLFNPEICAEGVCGGIFKALNNRSEINVPSDPESIRARAV